MIRIVGTAVTALVFTALALPAVAQDTNQPPPGPAASVPPPSNEGELFGGQLSPEAAAVAIGVGVLIIAAGSGSSGTTTTTTSP